MSRGGRRKGIDVKINTDWEKEDGEKIRWEGNGWRLRPKLGEKTERNKRNAAEEGRK